MHHDPRAMAIEPLLIAFGFRVHRYHAMANASQVQAIVAEWQNNEVVCVLAAKGFMARVNARSSITRRDVAQNLEVVKTIVRHLGLLVAYMEIYIHG